MNKISKKIVALVTMAAFVLTLVPAAAFAAADPAQSYFAVDTATANKLVVTVTLDSQDGSETVKADITGLKDDDSVSITGSATSTQTVKQLKDTGVTPNDTTLTFTVDKVAAGTTGTVGVKVADTAIELNEAGSEVESANYTVYGPADNQNSSYFTSKETVEVDAGETVETAFLIKTADNKTSTNMNNVVVWAEDAAGNITSAADFDVVANDENSAEAVVATTNNAKVFKVNADNGVADGTKVSVTFSRGGIYKIYAAVVENPDTNVADGQTRSVVFPAAAKLAVLSGAPTDRNVINVSDVAAADVAKIKVDDQEVADNGSANLASVLPNNTDKKTVTITALDKDNNVLSGKEFTVTTNSSKLTVSGSTTTDVFGKFDLSYQASAAGKYTIKVVCGDFNANLIVDIPKDTATPDKITVVKDGGVVDIATKDFSKAVQLDIVDKNGNSIAKTNANLTSKEPVWAGDVNGQKVENYVEIISQPDKAKLTDKDVRVKYDDTEGVYTLQIVNNPTLKAGEYTVRLALLSGNATDVTFKLAEAGEPVSIEIDGDDTVKAGQPYTATAYYVDANGIKTKIDSDTNMSVGYSGLISDSAAFDGTLASDGKIGFTAMSGKDYYGTKVTLYVVDTEKGIEAHKDVTVVDPTLTDVVTFEFDKTSGPISQDNTVKLTIKDEDGNVVKDITGEPLKAYVDSKSAEDANVSVEPSGNVTDGKATFTVYSDKETTADIRLVTVVDGKYYAGTLTYAFGEQDVPVDTSVVMTIGSNDFIVNNEVVSVEDAAPYVAKDRTFVPFRALGEAIGAEVEWDNDARTVTYTLGKTEVVMTIGETTYTVNGEEKTMDVAPEITNDRTYVPVRFVGEALGFKVTALSAADGTTASVVFQK